MRYISTIVIAWWITMVTAIPECLDVVVSEKDRKLQDDKLYNCNQGVDIPTCITTCKQDAFCKSISYGVKGSVRERCCFSRISKATTPTPNLVRDDSYVYYDVGQVNVTTEKEPVEQDLSWSKMNTCANEPRLCYNNGTCEETCGPVKYTCRCNLPNHGANCLHWHGAFSDFDLFFPRPSIQDYVSQTVGPMLNHILGSVAVIYYSLTIAFWVRPENSTRQVTLFSILDSTQKTIVRARLSGALKFQIEMGNNELISVPTDIEVRAKIWTHIRIRWTSNEHHKLQVKSDSGQEYSGGLPHGYHQTTSRNVVLVGQTFDESSGSFDPNWSFQGSISRLNIWNHWLDVSAQPEVLAATANLLAWPTMWDFYAPKIGGNVIKVPYSEVKKEWIAATAASVVDPVSHNDGVHSLEVTGTLTEPLSVKAYINSDCSKPPSYLSITLTPMGNPRKIRYHQIFTGQMFCYGVFGQRLRGSDVLNDSGIYTLDTSQDRIYSQHEMGKTEGRNSFASPLAGCGTSHFWYNNPEKTRQADVSRRLKDTSSKFTITTYARCGIGSLTVRNIYFMY